MPYTPPNPHPSPDDMRLLGSTAHELRDGTKMRTHLAAAGAHAARQVAAVGERGRQRARRHGPCCRTMCCSPPISANSAARRSSCFREVARGPHAGCLVHKRVARRRGGGRLMETALVSEAGGKGAAAAAANLVFLDMLILVPFSKSRELQ